MDTTTQLLVGSLQEGLNDEPVVREREVERAKTLHPRTDANGEADSKQRRPR